MADATNNTNLNQQAGAQPPVGNDGKNNGASNSNNNANANGEQTPKTFTQTEVDAILGKRLNEQEERLTKKFSEIVVNERTEAEKRAKMSEEEKSKAELEKREKELNDGKIQLALGQNKLTAVTELAKLQAPVDFVDWLVTPDADETAKRIKAFATKWQEAINAGIKTQLAGKAPQDLNTQNKISTDKVAKNYF